jgi:Skp family chaperone for outer membrane proteins
MKKYFVLLFILLLSIFNGNAQSRGIRIGYIDMEYILQNVPDYTEAKNQLEQKAQKWKQEIEVKKVDLMKLKDALKTERVLLTKELIEEREEEIKFQETELIEYQQKRFGPTGDLIVQKAVLVKPIQDQVFTAVQDISENKKYDYVFDKSSDLTMLFAAKRHDISDQVIRVITRAEKRQELSKKQLKEQEAKEYKEDVEDENPALTERRKALEEKKLAREKLIADKKLAAEQRKIEQEEKRKQVLADKEAKKTGTVSAKDKTVEKSTEINSDQINKDTETPAENSKEAKAAERVKIISDRKKALEDKKKKALEDREAAKKAKEEKIIEPKND